MDLAGTEIPPPVQPSAVTSQNPTTVFNLPLEIKIEIYKNTLLVDECLRYSRYKQLLQKNLEMAKTLDIPDEDRIRIDKDFYKFNRFDFTSIIPEQLELYTAAISPSNSLLIRNIQVYYPVNITVMHDALVVLRAKFPVLETVSLNVYGIDGNDLDTIARICEQTWPLLTSRVRIIARIRQSAFEYMMTSDKERLATHNWIIHVVNLTDYRPIRVVDTASRRDLAKLPYQVYGWHTSWRKKFFP